MKSNSLSNFSSRCWLSLVLIGVVVTRLPLLWNGYGSDPDAWRVANVGYTLWTTGEYQISRPPGYPLHEILTAPLIVWGGSLLSNVVTVLATLLLITVSCQSMRNAARHPRLLAFLIAFMPLIWLDSATTMDYIWSLLFIVLAFNDVDEKYIVRAGIWMGVAAGFRPSNIVAVLPLCVIIYITYRLKKPVAAFLIATFATTAVAFTPVLVHLGLHEWLNEIRIQGSNISLSQFDRVVYFGYRTLYAIGPLAALAVVWVVVVNRRLVRQLIRARDVTTIGYVVMIVSFLGLFFWFPLDRSYLLPAVFFLLFFIEKISTQKQFVVFIMCALSFSFVTIDVIQHGGAERAKPVVHFAPGILVEEIQKRERQLQDRTAIANISIEGEAMIMVGTSESFWFENTFVELDTARMWKTFNDPIVRKTSNHSVLFTSALNKAELGVVLSQGYTVYCVEEMKDYLESFVGYTIERNEH